MRKILFIIPNLRMGGAEKSLVSLLNSIDTNKYDIDLFLFERGGVLEKDIPSNVNILEFNPLVAAMTLEMRNYKSYLFNLKNKKYFYNKLYVTLLHKLYLKNMYKQFSYWKTVQKNIPNIEKKYDISIGCLEGMADFYVLDKVNAKSKIGWIHTDFSKKNISNYELNKYDEFNAIVTISNENKKNFCLATKVNIDKVNVIENITNKDEIIKKSLEDIVKWDNNYFHILSVGRLSNAKGMDIALEACKMLIDKNNKIIWHICGDGELREELENKINEYNLKDNFILEGLKENPYPYMKRADLIVQPSRFEGKSIVLDEVKLLGKPILVTNYPSVKDQIKNGFNGIICDINPQSICENIEKIILDKDLRDKLSKNCLDNSNDNTNNIINKFYKLIDSL